MKIREQNPMLSASSASSRSAIISSTQAADFLALLRAAILASRGLTKSLPASSLVGSLTGMIATATDPLSCGGVGTQAPSQSCCSVVARSIRAPVTYKLEPITTAVRVRDF